MKRSFVFLISAAVMVMVCTPALYGQHKQVIRLSGETILNLSTQGDITVKKAQRNEVVITSSDWDDDASDFFSIERKQGAIGLFLKPGIPPLDDLTLLVPEGMNLDLSSSYGDIRIEGDYKSEIRCRTSAGDISLKGYATYLEAKTSGGDINVRQVKGAAHLTTSGGDVTIGNVIRLTVSSLGGSIRVANVYGAAEIESSGGDISIGDVTGTAKIKTLGGEVRAGELKQAAEIYTGAGDVSVQSSQQSLKIESGAGDIRVGMVSGFCSLRSNAGDIHATIDRYKGIGEGSGFHAAAGDVNLRFSPDQKITFRVKVSRMTEIFIGNDRYPVSFNKNQRHDTAVITMNGGGAIVDITCLTGIVRLRDIR